MLEKPCFMFFVLLFLASPLLFSRLFLLHIRPPDKSVYHNQKSFSFFSRKHNVVGTQENCLNDGSFEHLKHMRRLMGKSKKIITNLG